MLVNLTCFAQGVENQLIQQLHQALGTSTQTSPTTTHYAQNTQQPTASQAQARTQTTSPTSSSTVPSIAERIRAQLSRRTPQASNEQNQPPPAAAQRQPQQQTNQENESGQTVGDLLSQSVIPPAIREAAFRSLVNQYMPMTPEQIIRLRKMFNQSQRAAATWPTTPPKPVSTSILVNLSPGATPPTVLLSAGDVTSLVFVDSTGAPWPIESYDLGNPRAFNIQWNKKSNTLMIQAKSLYTYGNIAVKLRNLNTPVMMTLIPGTKIVYYRADIRVPGFGPNAKAIPLGNGLPNAVSPVLLQVLNGVPPSGSTLMKVCGGPGRAWMIFGKLYLRTRLTVVSPQWTATMSSADGMHVYEMNKTPMVLASQRGKLVNLKIEGF